MIPEFSDHDRAVAATVVAAVAVSIALLQWALAALRTAWRRRMYAARMQHAAEGERRARQLLEGAGYAICGAQVAGSWTVYSDGAPLVVPLRVDYLVAREDQLFVAEVKTGKWAPRLDTAATRRQLLEYRCAFAVDGVLLVDPQVETIQKITFDLPVSRAPERRANRSIWFVCILLAAVAAGLAWGVPRDFWR